MTQLASRRSSGNFGVFLCTHRLKIPRSSNIQLFKSCYRSVRFLLSGLICLLLYLGNIAFANPASCLRPEIPNIGVPFFNQPAAHWAATDLLNGTQRTILTVQCNFSRIFCGVTVSAFSFLYFLNRTGSSFLRRTRIFFKSSQYPRKRSSDIFSRNASSV